MYKVLLLKKRKVVKGKIVLLILFLFLFCTNYSMAQRVTLKGKDFYLGNEKFYPMAVNYGIDGVYNQGSLFISPHLSYGTDNDYECSNLSLCATDIQADFNQIAGMGFDTVRIVGLAPGFNLNSSNLGVTFKDIFPHQNPTHIIPLNPSNPSDLNMQSLLLFYDKILELANATSPHPLKVILLVKGDSTQLNSIEVNLRTAFLTRVSSYLNNSSNSNALLAYDLMNEPCYNVNPVKTKQEACSIISTWYDAIKVNAPNHLVTIGGHGVEDVFSFDPSILKLDFYSLHCYPSFQSHEDRTDPSIQELARKRTANSLYWMQQASVIPWIIGETGFVANHSSIISPGLNGTLNDQGDYVTYSLNATCNCGGSGYSWWQYQDVYWGDPGQDFIGLLKRAHVPSPAAEKQPAVNIFRYYTPQVTTPCPVDYNPTFDANKLYYNSWQHPPKPGYEIARYVKDQDGNPIKDAAVSVWTKTNTGVYPMCITHTDVNGYFKAIPAPPSVQNYDAKIVSIWVSTAGADAYKSVWNTNGTSVPSTVYLNKIKDNVIVDGETVASGQYETYTGRKSLTVSNTTVQSGGNATFTSQQSITLLPGFTVEAGGEVSIYITPPDCNDMSSFQMQSIDNNSILKNEQEMKSTEPSFEKDLSESYISIFLTPANDTLTILLHSNDTDAVLNHIKLCDELEQELISISINAKTYTMDVSMYFQRIYFVEAKDKTNTYYQKLIIQ